MKTINFNNSIIMVRHIVFIEIIDNLLRIKCKDVKKTLKVQYDTSVQAKDELERLKKWLEGNEKCN